MARTLVRIAANFVRNLQSIEAFLTEQQAAAAFAALSEQLFARIIPNLERFPLLGADFLERKPLSVEGRLLQEQVKALLGSSATLREYITGDYIILYAVKGAKQRQEVFLLAIKHHRQLSFDFQQHWD